MIHINYELLQEINSLQQENKIELIFTRNLLTIIHNGERTLHPITDQTMTIDLWNIINQHKQMRANQSPSLFGDLKEGVEL